ncbi:hypothetical protein BGAL_0103g00110 [Botrytis galanthina]|uniref:Uncharacterized protein n=1 Tax=Botrytis galanthina TaxID=278940 RepID=A0A4S8R4K6_9HELO|nr:hypothetical protein BGAL_0103g00110 [Botrytis galanthina]
MANEEIRQGSEQYREVIESAEACTHVDQGRPKDEVVPGVVQVNKYWSAEQNSLLANSGTVAHDCWGKLIGTGLIGSSSESRRVRLNKLSKNDDVEIQDHEAREVCTLEG